MKKILFLLLLTVSAYGQTYQNPTYGTLTLKTSPTVNTHPYLTTTETNGVQSKVVSVMNQNANTGLLSGGVISVNADTTKWDLAFGEGYVADPLNGTVAKISWGTQTALTTPYLTTSTATYVLISNAGGGIGSVLLQNTPPTQQQYRTHVYLGKLAHTTKTTILFAVPEPSRMFDVVGQVMDLNATLKSINSEGNIISANGTNLNLNVSAGKIYRAGANYASDRNNPSLTSLSSGTAITFRNKFRDGSGGWTAVNTSTVDADHYDDGTGILATVPNNKFTVRIAWRFGSTGTVHLDYGQAVYDNLKDAKESISTAIVSKDPDNVKDASIVGYIVVKKGTTALNNTSENSFYKASMFGEAVLTAGGTTDLKGAYDNSVSPQITTTTTGGAVTIKRGSASDTDNILVGQNGAGTNTFSVTGAGNVTAGLSTGGNILTDFGNQTGYRYKNSSGNTVFQITDQGASQGAYRIGTASAYIEGRESGPQYLKTSIPLEVPTPTASNHAVTKAYADGLVVGLLDDRGTYDASTNLFPSTGGSGTAGAILKGDIWYVGTAGTLGGKSVAIGDSFRALVDSPGQTASNWALLSSNLSYVPANDANVVHLSGAETISGAKTSTGGFIMNSGLHSSSSGVVVASSGSGTDFFINSKNISFGASLSTSAITGSDKTFTFPNTSGTFALTSDLSNYVSLSGTETITGNKTINNQLNFSGSLASILFNNDTSILTSTVARIARLDNMIGIFGSGASARYGALLSTDNLTTVKRTFTFPDQSGTFALTSNPTSITATSFIKSGATAGNILLAGGADIAQSTFQTALTNPVTGTGTSGYLAKWTGTGTQGDSLVYDNGTSVGIGTTSPLSKFHSFAGALTISNEDTYSARFSNNSNKGVIIGYDTTNNVGHIGSINPLIAWTNLSINANGGNVLIGTATDDGVNKLQVNGDISATTYSGGIVRLKSYTVATLPAGTQGDTAYVTDALAPTFLATIVGGGAVVTPVFYNGTNWVAH